MPTTFMSRNRDMRVVISPGQNIHGVNAGGMNSVIGTTGGKTIQFTNGRYVSKSAEETEALRNAVTFNQEIWEVGNEPGALRPPTDKMIADASDAAMRHDIERLRALRELETVGDGEQGGHNRQEVLTAIDVPLGLLTDGKEGKRRAGRPHPPKPAISDAEARKAQTVPDVA